MTKTETPAYARTFSATTRHIINPEQKARTLCGGRVSLPETYVNDSGVTVHADPWMVLELPPCKRCEASHARRTR